jgi:hypothetical protein
MKEIIEYTWQQFKEQYEDFKKNEQNLVFHDENYDVYDELFRNKYQDILNRFMRETTELDSHKQAALITICCLEADVITHKVAEGTISIIPEIIAVNVGMSYMNDRLNELLKKKRIERRIPQYSLPLAISCETPYMEIICRLLYYNKNEEDMCFNVLELSDRYFLLEYINLIQNGIEPYLLK